MKKNGKILMIDASRYEHQKKNGLLFRNKNLFYCKFSLEFNDKKLQ